VRKINYPLRYEIILFMFLFVFALGSALFIVGDRAYLSFFIVAPFIMFAVFQILKDAGYVLRKKPDIRIKEQLLRKNILPVILAFAIGILILNYFMNLGEFSSFERLIASLVVFFGFIPTFICIYYRVRIPFLSMFGIMYVVIYALPVFTLTLDNYNSRVMGPVTQEGTIKALILSALGIFTLLLSYYIFPGSSIGRILPKINVYWDFKKIYPWSIILGLIGLICTYLVQAQVVPILLAQIAKLGQGLLLFFIGVLFFLQLKKKLSLIGKFLLWGFFIPLKVSIHLGTGLAFHVIETVFFPFFIYICFRRRVPWKTIIPVIIIGFITLVIIKVDYRQLIWSSEYENRGLLEKTLIFPSVVWENISGQTTYSYYYDVITMRFARLQEFARVVDWTPESLPYLKGETYRIFLLWRVIPRLFYWDKPTGTDLEIYSHRYNMQYHEDYTSSTRLPQLIEMYINFGIPGVLIGMFLMGIIYRAIYEMLCHPKAGEGGLLIAIFIFTKLLDIEGDSSVLAMAVYYMVFLILVSNLVRMKSKPV